MNRREIVVYVAGHYRAPTWGQVKRNVGAAMDVAAELLRAGFSVICPHSMTHSFEMYRLEDDVFLDSDRVLLARCDAVVLLPGAANSSGTRAEIAFAAQHGIPVIAWDAPIERDDWFATLDRMVQA
jgi:nucleoside 2-deoxyribosyltransferase